VTIATQQKKRRTGRRPGPGVTREAIAAAAGRQFGELGYERTTIRGIAKEAKVDPALVLHFFGSKRELFNSATILSLELDEALPQIIDGPRSMLGRRITRWVVDALEQPESRQAITGILRAAVSDPEAAQAARDVVTARVLAPIAEHIDADRPELRASLVNSQMVGVIMGRYIVPVEPLASMSPSDLVDAIAPTVQRYLTRPLGTGKAGSG
jgi:AcrR family transcriptional regulator